MIPEEAPRAVDPDELPTEGPGSLATVGQRAVARIIDVLIVSLPLTAVSLIWFSEVDDGDLTAATPVWVIAAFFALDFAYEVTLVRYFGRTIGKMIMGIRIVALTDGGNPDWTGSGIRFLVPGVAGAIPIWFSPALAGGVYLTALIDPALRGVHDKGAGTVVVRAR